MRLPITLLAASLAIAFAPACKSDSNDVGQAPADGGVTGDAGRDGGPGDGGGVDAAPPDTGPLPCLRDQGGPDKRGCNSGEVCNLSMNPPRCVPGRACNTDGDCDICSRLQVPTENCGHGFKVTSFCDDRHGNVCTRSRSPCEPCTVDKDCGRGDPILPISAPKCLAYGNGEAYCGRNAAFPCPAGFAPDPTNQCRRETCDPNTVICPGKMAGQPCAGTDQICAGAVCPAGGNCAGNEQIGGVGICLRFCQTNVDCAGTPDRPTCNTQNHICVAGCTKGSCPNNQTCHRDGQCRAPCTDNADCEMRYGMDTYCNRRGQPPPRYYKTYHDDLSCTTLGCESAIDCSISGVVCDKGQTPPACVRGCYKSDDCNSGEQCKSTGGEPHRMSYTRPECRALPVKTDMTELGVCCNPGCVNRNTQCQRNYWCCGEVASPYENPNSCLTLTSTGGRQAESGECFQMQAPVPWCKRCTASSQCNSGWTPGQNVDPMINGGQPFQEQEFCTPIAMGLAICGVTCNPSQMDQGRNACPANWRCLAVTPRCYTDAHCGGLPCFGANPDIMQTGVCKCGENGVPAIACPTSFASLDGMVTHPRCVPQGAEMVCIAGFNCTSPQQPPEAYPAGCGF